MQDQIEMVKEIINTFLNDRKDGKKQLVDWFLNTVMEEEAMVQEWNREDRRFTSDQSLIRLVVSIMMDINGGWVTGRKYINMEVN